MLKSSTTVLIWCLSVCAVCSAERVDQVRHLDLRKDEDFRYINIQLQWVSAWLLLWLGVGIHLLLDIAKIAIMGARRGRWPQVAYAFACFYPVYYSFEMTFMYVNDGWYPLLPMQLYFTFTDSFAWCYAVAVLVYGVRPRQSATLMSVAVKVSHVVFNCFIERGWTSPAALRNAFFLLEDVLYVVLATPMLGVPLVKLCGRARFVVAFYVVILVFGALFVGSLTSLS